MSRNKPPRKRYRPRQIAVNTLGLALHRCAKPAREDRAEVLGMLSKALASLREGTASEHDWSIAAGGVATAQAIERQGVVRGLSQHLAGIEAALQAIYNRCRRPSLWLRPTLTEPEIEATHLLLELHTFQLEHLSRSELIAAVDQAQKQTLANGYTATVVREDIESMAA